MKQNGKQITLMLLALLYSTLLAAAPVLPDTTELAKYRYVRFLSKDAKVEVAEEDFFKNSGIVIFPVNVSKLDTKSELIEELRDNVIPMINKDSLNAKILLFRSAASPEGQFAYNKRLSVERGQSLVDFFNQHLDKPLTEEQYRKSNVSEDYHYLLMMMKDAADPDYDKVKKLCDTYLPTNRYTELEKKIREVKGGLFGRLNRKYFPQLRATRFMLFVEMPEEEKQPVVEEVVETPVEQVTPEVTPESDTPVLLPTLQVYPRREFLSLKTNLLFDFAYMPGYKRFCPIPNVAVEYYPLHGHFTYGASFDCPWWKDYWAHKFFQVRNYQIEARYYLRSGDVDKNPPGEGAAFRGLYFNGYAHAGLYDICFDENRGWEGEGFGAGAGIGYVLPLSRDGHWRLDFGIQFGFFRTQYDPYQWECPVDPTEQDHKYYYKWTLDADLFKKRQYRYNWIGPTRIGISISYDLLYRRIQKKGVSFKKSERY